MIQNRIGLKLGLWMISLFLLVLVFLGAAIDRIFTNFHHSDMENSVNEMTAHFVTMASSPETATDHSLDAFADFSDVSMFFVNRNGEVAAHSGDHDPMDRAFIRKSDVSKVFSGHALNFTHTDPYGKRYLVSVMGVPSDENGGAADKALYVLASTAHMDESISRIRQLLIISGLGAFLLAMGVVWIAAQVLSRPLLQMQRATRKIAAGDLETRLNISSKDEVGSLAGAINDLARDLQRYRDTRQEFFANISHELRTPITYLEGYARVVREQLYASDEEKEKYLEIIQEEAVRLQRLVNDLFELSKMEEGRISLTMEWIDLKEIAGSAARKMEWKVKEKGLVMRTVLEGEVPLIRGDGLRMEQILLNMLDNAVRYTEHGEVALIVRADSSNVCVAVEDSGAGIPEDELPLIFDRFYRVEKSRSRQHGGTGLGLAIAKKLVELQDGTLNVSSKPGVGTRFDICFPVPAGEEEKA
ncbi:sensor histidine kinase [Paenibacillus sp. DMB20]|uniref:sensor histidine kinase n=1 Tax=Paenibacillus sp. DMB20 TaxID=1642570 RepID=UPI000627A864|nr:HAMP domain-containing sensor histidine kinase [Paenibacillus sp. DMB20]KKO54771.1 transcriptional regulator [Paenibacillus sp. DMB20]KKO55287.1 transcriptional regulator [Paenibacillus sp. DMB20]